MRFYEGVKGIDPDEDNTDSDMIDEGERGISVVDKLMINRWQ